jgi:hypothetical protein
MAAEPKAVQAPPPWLDSERLALAAIILASHHQGFGRPLLAGLDGDAHNSAAPTSQAQELFAAATVVMAHGGGDDPKLIYANRAALQLWRRPWSEQVGLPSRLTAEPQERAGRAALLSRALDQQAIGGYQGIRIDSQGRRFVIRNARLWTLWTRGGEPCGQAAAFSDWWWL